MSRHDTITLPPTQPCRRVRTRRAAVIAIALMSAAAIGSIGTAVHASPLAAAPSAPHLLTTLPSHSGLGSTIGPDGALYFPEPAAGRISRVDPHTGAVSTFAGGLPVQFIPLAGVMDVAFINDTAYALVTLINPDLFPGSPYTAASRALLPVRVGIYRIDGLHRSTLIADIGRLANDHPPTGFPFYVPSGVQYALDNNRSGFIVTDGHHNRLLSVELDGTITQVAAYGVDPTGMDVSGNSELSAEAGPTSHLPGNATTAPLNPGTITTTEITAAARFVDLERGPGQTLYALSQGTFQVGNDAGKPANPNTGSLVSVDGHGGFATVATGLDRPTSMEIIQNSAYIATLDGDIWVVDDIANAPFGK
jgi:hypothetical protein